MKKFYYTEKGTQERCRVCFSSKAKNPEQAMETLTMETGGNCLGPSDWENEAYEEALHMVTENWNDAEEMSVEEARERIEHLADEWGLNESELEYLE